MHSEELPQPQHSNGEDDFYDKLENLVIQKQKTKQRIRQLRERSKEVDDQDKKA